jgi:hypothetical protein
MGQEIDPASLPKLIRPYPQEDPHPLYGPGLLLHDEGQPVFRSELLVDDARQMLAQARAISQCPHAVPAKVAQSSEGSLCSSACRVTVCY